MISVVAGPYTFELELEEALAPATVRAFERLLPLTSQILHVRWSGEAAWIPMGDLELDIEPENATSYPHPGEVLLYPKGVSETELLLGYGYTRFASKAGQLAGNHFASVVGGRENLRPLGELVLWQGAQEITFTKLENEAVPGGTARRV